MADDWNSRPRPDDPARPEPKGTDAWWHDPPSASEPPLREGQNWPPRPVVGDPLAPRPSYPAPEATPQPELPPQFPPPLQPAFQPAPPAPQLPPLQPVAARQPLGPGVLVLAGRMYGPAGFGLRLRAFLLDWVFLALLSWGLAYIVHLPPADPSRALRLSSQLLSSAMRGELADRHVQDELDELVRPQRFLGWLQVGLCACYFILFHGLAGATLGKAACGLTVLRQDGQPLGLGRAAIRYLGYFILAKLFYGTFTMLFDPQRRAVHDFVSGSNVYHELRWR